MNFLNPNQTYISFYTINERIKKTSERGTTNMVITMVVPTSLLVWFTRKNTMERLTWTLPWWFHHCYLYGLL